MESTDTTTVDTELLQLNISEQLRANSSFMKIMATLFHYGNQAMNAAQLVIAVRALNLLPLRGETPKSTIQGIISTSRKIARDLKLSDPFRIDKDGVGRQAKYAIADEIMNGVETPVQVEIPDEPIILRPVEYSAPPVSYKRPRNKSIGKPVNKKSRTSRRRRTTEEGNGDSDVEVGSDDEDFNDFTSMTSEDEGTEANEIIEEDTIADYSLLYNPPTSDVDYIDRINFSQYPIAGHFAIVQQKGYSYPRFRSHEKIKIPKVNCEDKFRVTDIIKDDKVIGRLFILADGHGGPGCSEYFVRQTPLAVSQLCSEYDINTLGDEQVQKKLEAEIKIMIQALDDTYLELKRQQIANKAHPDDHVDNDGCTLILNILLGEWLINVNVGDSRTVLISAPEPSSVPPTSIENANTLGIDNDYKMDVVFASQDHKPYLEHLARHILENGGEFVDSVQNRVIKVDLNTLKEDGNRHTKRVALKNARIRPKDYQAGLDKSLLEQSKKEEKDGSDKEEELEESISEGVSPKIVQGFAAQSAVRTTVVNTTNHHTTAPATPTVKHRLREDRIPSLNVARSCGDLDFKMDPEHKIISCEPDVTFIRISDQPYVDHTILLNGPHKEKRRHFLFMSTDGTFDYMYEETAERQNRAIAKVIGPMIEDGEKIGKYLLEEEERVKGATIEHKGEGEEIKEESGDASKEDEATAAKTQQEEEEKKEEQEKDNSMDVDVKLEEKAITTETKEEETEEEPESENGNTVATSEAEPMEVDQKEELPRIPLLHRELTTEETEQRKIKERTLVSSARYFANREGAHGFFASTLQDYDDCTIILVEI